MRNGRISKLQKYRQLHFDFALFVVADWQIDADFDSRLPPAAIYDLEVVEPFLEEPARSDLPISPIAT